MFYRLNAITLLLTFVVVVLGAFVRLSDAGLGCPDWPGCYGELLVPGDAEAASAAYPERPLETGKAWKEMIHRYAAGVLGLLILSMAVVAWRARRMPRQPVALPIALVGVVVFQSILGMWTVTWQLKPLAVTAHLLGGMALLALLVLCLLRSGGHLQTLPLSRRRSVAYLAGLLLLALAGQLFLGAWTSSNYAALACPDFPTCQGRWWPETDFGAAYTLWRGLGVNYEYGVLDSVPRATVHFTHRLGAMAVLVLALALAVRLWWTGIPQWRRLAMAMACAAILQVGLGVAAVVAHLPLVVAVAHNAGAGLLTLLVMMANHAIWRARPA